MERLRRILYSASFLTQMYSLPSRAMRSIQYGPFAFHVETTVLQVDPQDVQMSCLNRRQNFPQSGCRLPESRYLPASKTIFAPSTAKVCVRLRRNRRRRHRSSSSSRSPRARRRGSKIIMVPASRARFHDAETYVLTLKKSRVVDRGGRARRGTERVDGKRVDASLTCVPYWYFLSHDSSDGLLQQLCMTHAT